MSAYRDGLRASTMYISLTCWVGLTEGLALGCSRANEWMNDCFYVRWLCHLNSNCDALQFFNKINKNGSYSHVLILTEDCMASYVNYYLFGSHMLPCNLIPRQFCKTLNYIQLQCFSLTSNANILKLPPSTSSAHGNYGMVKVRERL